MNPSITSLVHHPSHPGHLLGPFVTAIPTICSRRSRPPRQPAAGNLPPKQPKQPGPPGPGGWLPLYQKETAILNLGLLLYLRSPEPRSLRSLSGASPFFFLILSEKKIISLQLCIGPSHRTPGRYWAGDDLDYQNIFLFRKLCVSEL